MGEMVTVGIAHARQHFAELIEQAQHEPVGLSRHGETQAVVVSSAVYERMLAAYEEYVDAQEFDAAMRENSPNLPWDEVKRELGWQ